MQIYLIGEKLSHSFSPMIHKYLASYLYEIKEISPPELAPFLKGRGFDGLNVTIPYKSTVTDYLDRLSSEAERIGAVNTIKNDNGILTGYNTDYYGFIETVLQSGAKIQGKRAVIIGSGGASKAVLCALEDMGASQIRVLSHRENNEKDIQKYKDAQIIVNATPVGMYPGNYISPVDLSLFKDCEAVFDLIYNPHKTRLLQSAESMGKIYANGLTMLVSQAKKAAEIFTASEIDRSKINEIKSAIEKTTKNIVLVGMPGCGKTTVGRKLSQALGRKFVDSDEEIERLYMKPSSFLINFGEEKFREAESDVLMELCKKSGMVIATGGGAVTVEKNFPIIKENGFIVFIDRDIKLLATNGRPLSKGQGALKKMESTRRVLYEKICDLKINAENVDLTVRKICDAFMEMI